MLQTKLANELRPGKASKKTIDNKPLMIVEIIAWRML